MIRALVSAALAATLAGSASPVAAQPTPVPHVPLPTSYAELPLGPSTAVPWWQAGVLHLGAVTIRTRLPHLMSRGGTTVVGSGWDLPGRRSTLSLVRDSTLAHLPVRGHIRGPAISADGHWIAWLDEQARPVSNRLDRVHYRLVLFDATTRRIVAQHHETRRVEHDDAGNSAWLVSVANTGQVLFSRGKDGPHVLAPGQAAVRLKGRVPGLRSWDGWPLGITVFRSRHGEERGRYGTVSRRGRFRPAGSTSYPVGTWSPDGGSFAFVRQGATRNTYWVDRPGLGAVVQLGLPGDRDQLVVVGWEDSGTVLLWDDVPDADPPIRQLVRCAVATGDCQRVEGGPVPGRPAALAQAWRP